MLVDAFLGNTATGTLIEKGWLTFQGNRAVIHLLPIRRPDQWPMSSREGTAFPVSNLISPCFRSCRLSSTEVASTVVEGSCHKLDLTLLRSGTLLIFIITIDFSCGHRYVDSPRSLALDAQFVVASRLLLSARRKLFHPSGTAGPPSVVC